MKIPFEVQKLLDRIETEFDHFTGKMRASNGGLPKYQAISKDNLDYSRNVTEVKRVCTPYWQNMHCLQPKNTIDINDSLSISPYVYQLAVYLGADIIPLMSWYDEGGYVCWHHNADVPGRNILFNWSEKGEGVFKKYNEKSDIITEYEDIKGWQVKHNLFYGHHDASKYGYSWHSMYTDCNRFSLAFRINDTNWTNDLLEEFGFSTSNP